MKNSYCCFFFTLSLLITLSHSLIAQEKCGLPAYMQLLQKQHPHMADEGEFEQWIQARQVRRRKASGSQHKEEQTIYQIPVVVHVIHNGEIEGEGSNISESQILSQLETLNQDFRMRNESQINQLPESFRALAADTRIEFVLARQDPEGLPTSAITRRRGNQESYSIDDDLKFKAQVHWPPDDYLNLYSATLSGNLIGYAQFPETDHLAGLDLGMTSAQTDGVVVDYRYFGTGGSAVSGSRGRTATHEIGHFLGLRHIWGDGGCNRDDYVEDTPGADGSHNGCPTDNPESCGSADMYQNYMDYTADRCMSLFTQGQAERMEVVMQHSPRRNTLPFSRALEEPTIVPDDAGIRQLALNLSDICSKDFIPAVEIRNYGSNPVNSVEIGLFINDRLHFQQTLTLELDHLESVVVDLPEVMLQQRGQFIAEARVLSTNGRTDNKEFNNSRFAELYAPELRNPPYLQDFETSLSPFYRINPDRNLTWELATAPITGQGDNLAIFMDFFDYSFNVGAKDLLVSPIIDLSQENMAFLNFRVAHATYGRDSRDRLEVYVSTDCSESLETAVRIYDKAGSALASAPSTETPFVPRDNQDWRNELLDLSAFVGNSQVQLIFVGTNDYGNNLYLDDIDIFTQPRNQLDVALREISTPSVVSCNQTPVPSILIRNMGSETIQSLDIHYALNDGTPEVFSLQNMNLASQESQQVALPQLAFNTDGPHTLSISLSSPNQEFDENPDNNSRAKDFVINTEEEVIPLRERFKSASFSNTPWVSTNPNPEFPGWLIRDVPGPNGNGGTTNFAVVSEFFERERGLENWLVSPVLDLSEVSLAGLQFRYSYAPLSFASDILQVRVSADCGETWNDIVYERKGSELSAEIVNSRWTPLSSNDWFTAFINLSDYVGMSNVRVAIIAISDGGNDLFLDDIEFFESDQPITVQMPEENDLIAFPNPSSEELNVIFNLRQREDVQLQLYTSQGRLVYQVLQPNTLNQLYTIITRNYHPGVYILRVSSPSLQKSERIVIAR
jgi:hypothetical protein